MALTPSISVTLGTLLHVSVQMTRIRRKSTTSYPTVFFNNIPFEPVE